MGKRNKKFQLIGSYGSEYPFGYVWILDGFIWDGSDRTGQMKALKVIASCKEQAFWDLGGELGKQGITANDILY
jgi:hypothetical protein